MEDGGGVRFEKYSSYTTGELQCERTVADCAEVPRHVLISHCIKASERRSKDLETGFVTF